MTTLHADLAFIQNVLDAAPFHRWLGMKAASIENDTLRLVVPWREELVSNPRLQSAHGGVLAAIIDLGGFYALIATGNMPAATADLRVDYHAPALPGTLLADVPAEHNVWMSHGDSVAAAPEGFTVLASTSHTPVAAFERAADATADGRGRA